jgi:hypothetical protein
METDEHGGSHNEDDEGFFLIHRRFRHGPYYLNPGLLQTLMYCLSHAAFRPVVVPMRTGNAVTRVSLGAGQFITGRLVGSAELHIPPGTFWDRMKKMQELGTISIESNNHFSIVTVCKWESYQNVKTKRRQHHRSTPSAPQQQPNSTTAAPPQHPDTKNELLTIRNNEEQEREGPAADGPQSVLDAWNATKGATATGTLGPTRLNEVKLRLLDPSWRWRDALAKFPLRCYASDPEGWQPTFDWFIKIDTVTKILERTYDFTKDKKHANRPSPSSQQFTPDSALGGI